MLMPARYVLTALPVLAYVIGMYTRTHRTIKITVVPLYLKEQSDPDDSHFVWAYTIQLEKSRAETVQLLNRYWHITDARGRAHEVRVRVSSASSGAGAGLYLPIYSGRCA